MKRFMQHYSLFSIAMLIMFACFAVLGFIAVPESAFALPLIGLTTLAANTPRTYELGDLDDFDEFEDTSVSEDEQPVTAGS